jgi:hypothetical protein
MWEKRPYPPRAILGTPYEFATTSALPQVMLRAAGLAPAGYSERLGSSSAATTRQIELASTRSEDQRALKTARIPDIPGGRRGHLAVHHVM